MKQTRLALSMTLLLAAQVSHANPQGAQVVRGSASFSQPSSQVLNVTNSRNAIINWQQFNIDRGQTTNFIQPSASSSVLNRVIGNDPSRILGNLNSNGRVFLINQNGILVGEGAHINTGSFFASTLNITDEDFLNGNLKFNDGGQGDLQNHGYIQAGDDGNIVLIAPNIENGGVIEVENGQIILAAGESITITSLKNASLQFEVQSPEHTVTNLGQVIARNGAASLFAGTLKHSGSIRAGGLVRDADGRIRLVAADSNQVSGTVQAAGGKIEILGDTVEITQDANVDASSQNGGGEILIGGDQQGLNPDVQNATSTTIELGAQVHADGLGKADGGKVIVFAENDVHVQGEVTARGGAQGGDGGFIETSGKQTLDITAVPDASAANGINGSWLIDPYTITIVAGTGATGVNAGTPFVSSADNAQLGADLIMTALNSGTSVIVSTGVGGLSFNGDINVETSILKTGGGDASLTLNAHDDINIGNGTGVTIDITSISGVMDVILNSDIDADGNGVINFHTGFGNSAPITINTNGGVLTTNNDVVINGDVSNTFSIVNILNTQWDMPRDGALTLDEDLKLDLTGTTVLANGHININDFSAVLDLSGDTLEVPVGGSLVGSGTVAANVQVNGGSISGGSSYSSNGQLNINGNLSINSGLMYSVIGGFSTSWESNSISANNIAINGGDLMAVWADASAAGFASNDPLFASLPLTLASCGGTGCMSGTGFNTIVNPLMVSNSSVVLGAGNGDELRYGISYATDIVNNASIDTWQGPQVGAWNVPSNWFDGTVPTASDYVFFTNSDGVNQLNISGAQAAAGIQSFGTIVVQNGTLSLGGDSFMTHDFFQGSGGFVISDANARVDGAGVLYSGPGSSVVLDQGILAKDVVSWGRAGLFDATTDIQLDSNFVNNGLLLVDDSQAVNNITGIGSITNNGLLEIQANLLASVDINNMANGLIVVGTGFNTLFDANTTLDGSLQVDPGATLNLDLGAHNFAPTLSQTGDLVFNGGAYTGTFNQPAAGNLEIRAGSGDVLFDGFTLNSLGSMQFTSTGSDLLLVNGAVWTNSGTVDFQNTDATADIVNDDAGFTSLINTFSGVMNVSNSTNLDFFTPFDNQGTVNVTGTSIFATNNSVTLSGSIDIAAGATYSIDNGTNSRLSLTGSPTISGSGLLVVDNAATFDVTAPLFLPAAMTLQLNDGGSIFNAQNLALPDTFNIFGGTITGQGTWITPFSSGASINIGGAAPFTLDGQGDRFDWIVRRDINWDAATANTDIVLANGGRLIVNELLNLTNLVPGAVIRGSNGGRFVIGPDGVLLHNIAEHLDINVVSNIQGLLMVGLPNTAASLSINGGSGLELYNGGILQGYGTYVGDVLVSSGGMIEPGESSYATNGISTLTIDGNVTFDPGSTAIFKLDAATADSFDQLNVTGNVVLNNPDLLTVWDNVSSLTPQTPTSPYALISASGTVSGSFNTVIDAVGITLPVTSVLANSVTYDFSTAALDNFWTGAGVDDNWDTAANWNQGVPTAGQTLVIDDAFQVQLTTSTAALQGAQISAEFFDVQAGGNLQLAGDFITTQGTDFDFSDVTSTISGSGIWRNYGYSTAYADVMTLGAAGLSLQNHGRFAWTPAGSTSSLTLASPIDNFGALLMRNTSGFSSTLDLSGGVSNSGSFITAVSSDIQVSGTLTNNDSGIIIVSAGEMQLQNDNVSNGQILIRQGGTLSDGILSFGKSGVTSLTLGGSAQILGGGIFEVGSSGTLDVTVPTEFKSLYSAGLTLHLNGGTIDNAQNLTLPDTFNINGGALNGNGVLVSDILQSNVININDGAGIVFSVNGLDLDLMGTSVNWNAVSSTDDIVLNNASLIIGDQFSINNADSIPQITGSNGSLVIRPDSYFSQFSGSGIETTVAVPVTSNGIIEVFDPTATLTFTGGDLNLANGAALAGNGTIRIGASGTGNVFLNAGARINPGWDVPGIGNTGRLTIDGNVTFGADSVGIFEINSPFIGDNGLPAYDHLEVTGNVIINGGNLFVLWDDFANRSISATDTLDFITASNITGDFASVNNPLGITVSTLSNSVTSYQYTVDTIDTSAIVYWTGGAGSSNWQDGANWNTGAEPNANDLVVLDTVSVDLNSISADLGGLQNGSELNIGPGGNLVVSGDFVSHAEVLITGAGNISGTGLWSNLSYASIQSSSSVISIAAIDNYSALDWVSLDTTPASLTIAGSMTNWGSHSWFHPNAPTLTLNYSGGFTNRAIMQGFGNLAAMTVLGDFTQTAGAQMLLDPASLLFNGNSSLDGSLFLNSAQPVSFGGNTHNFGSGLAFNSDLIFDSGSYTGQLIVPAVNTLSITQAGGAVVFDGLILDTLGSVDVAGSANGVVLSNAANWSVQGPLNLAAGSQLDAFSGAILSLTAASDISGSAGGMLSFDSGANLDVATATDFAAAAVTLNFTNSGSGTFDADVNVANLNLDGGDLANNANLTVTNLQWSAGSIGGAGNTQVTGQANLPATGNMTLDQPLTLQANTNWGGGPGVWTVNSAGLIDNQGVFTDTSTSSIIGTGAFNNNGAYILNSPDTSLVSIGFTNNLASIELQAGTLDLAGNTLILGGGTLQGSGTLVANVTADNGSVIAPGSPFGTLTIDGTLNFAAGSRYDFEMDNGVADQIVTSAAISIDNAAQFNLIPLNGYIGNLNDGGSALSSSVGISGAFPAIISPADFILSSQYVVGPPDSLDIFVTGLNNIWIGSDGAWEDIANWSRNQVPGAGHELNMLSAGQVTYSTAGALSINSLQAAEGSALNFSNGVQLSVVKDFIAPGNVSLDASNLQVAQLLSAGSLTVANGATVDGNGSGDLFLASLLLQGGTLSGWNSVNAAGWTVSGINTVLGSTLSQDGDIAVTGTTDRLILGNGVVLNSGSTASFSGSGTLEMQGDADWTLSQPMALPASLGFNLVSGVVNEAQFLTLDGAFGWQSGTLNGTATATDQFTTNGPVMLLGGNLNTDWLIGAASVVDWTDPLAGDLIINNATITNQGQFQMAGAATAVDYVPGIAGKNFSASSGASFINQGLLLIDAGVDTVVFDLAFDNAGGQIGILSGSFRIGAGDDLVLDQAAELLFGSGTFEGNVINQQGIVTPGRFIGESTGTIGELTINGNYRQLSGGSLILKLDATPAGLQNDVLNVAGQLDAAGSIDFKLVNGSTILQVASLIDQSFRPLKVGSFTGGFTSTTIPDGLNFTLGDGGVLTITSDNPLLNEVNNQLEVLFTKDDLNYDKVVRAMRFVDEKLALQTQSDEDDEEEKKRAPRLVCK